MKHLPHFAAHSRYTRPFNAQIEPHYQGQRGEDRLSNPRNRGSKVGVGKKWGKLPEVQEMPRQRVRNNRFELGQTFLFAIPNKEWELGPIVSLVPTKSLVGV